MQANAFSSALTMMWTLDGGLLAIVALSVAVSASAALLAACIGLPLGAWVALTSSRAAGPIGVVLNAAMGIPPVVVGLLVYLLLSRSGPAGALGWLFTPWAMVVAQTILVAPLVAALTRQVIQDKHLHFRDWFNSLRLTPTKKASVLLWECRYGLVTVVLAGFGRAIAEVGAVMMVGGNIEGATRVMTTAIALEISKGDLPLAIALGAVLLLLVLFLNVLVALIKRRFLRAEQ
jgi:tungstate transport system permease protein